MNYTVILDGAGKAAAGVGVLLGMAYVAGVFKILGFYSSFRAEWLFESVDVQGFINEGLPLVMLFLTFSAVLLMFLIRLNPSKHKKFIFFVIILVAPISLFVFIDIPGYEQESKLTVYAASIGVVGAALVSWIFHLYVSSGYKDLSAVHVVCAILIVFWASPYLAGKARADNIINAQGDATEIFDANNRVVGVLVRYIGGKYLILDCNVSGQLRLEEPSPLLFLRRSSGKCKAIM